jgi:hypothetical protein
MRFPRFDPFSTHFVTVTVPFLSFIPFSLVPWNVTWDGTVTPLVPWNVTVWFWNGTVTVTYPLVVTLHFLLFVTLRFGDWMGRGM